MKAVGPVITSNGVPYIQMTSIGSHSTSGREKKGMDYLGENYHQSGIEQNICTYPRS